MPSNSIYARVCLTQPVRLALVSDPTHYLCLYLVRAVASYPLSPFGLLLGPSFHPCPYYHCRRPHSTPRQFSLAQLLLLVPSCSPGPTTLEKPALPESLAGYASLLPT